MMSGDSRNPPYNKISFKTPSDDTKADDAWQVTGVSPIVHETDYVVKNPPFSVESATWILRMYPSGQSVYKSSEFIDVLIESLYRQDAGEHEIFLEIIRKDEFGRKINAFTRKIFTAESLRNILYEQDFMQNVIYCHENWRTVLNDNSAQDSGRQRNDQKKQDAQEKSDVPNKDGGVKKKAAGIVVGAVSGAAATVGGVTVAIPAIGFGTSGVAAGSIAAGIHSMIGNVAAGSLFASLQSAGVLGLATGTKVAIGTAGAIVGGATGFVVVTALGAGIYASRKSEAVSSATAFVTSGIAGLATGTKALLGSVGAAKHGIVGGANTSSTASPIAGRIVGLVSPAKILLRTSDTAENGIARRETASSTTIADAGHIVGLASYEKVKSKTAVHCTIKGVNASSIVTPAAGSTVGLDSDSKVALRTAGVAACDTAEGVTASPTPTPADDHNVGLASRAKVKLRTTGVSALGTARAVTSSTSGSISSGLNKLSSVARKTLKLLKR